MGQHIVPRHLLRRISPDRRTIWMYDKVSMTLGPKQLPIAQVSQTKNFFSEDIEKLLSTIEGAASPILDKLTQGQPIDPIERRVMAVYLEMYKTRSREMRDELIEKFLGDRNKIENFMETSLRSMPETTMYTAYKNQKENVINLLESSSEQAFAAVWAPSNLDRFWFFRMTWRVLESTKVDFVVGDPPWVLTGKKDGLGNFDAEFLFPLSSSHVLHMSWRGTPSTIDRELISPMVARQVNKKFIGASFRFVFFNRNCPKMARAIENKNLYHEKIKLERPVLGDNPYRPGRLWKFTHKERDKLSEYICMHPAASNFRHAWHKAMDHSMVAGGEVIERCVHCLAMKLKYGDDTEPIIRNDEVRLATGRLGNHRNWWMRSEVKFDH